MGSDDTSRVLELIREEQENPEDYQRFIAKVNRVIGGKNPVLELLILKDKHHRLTYFIESQKLWMKLILLKLIKAMMISAILIAIPLAFIFRSQSYFYFCFSAVGIVVLYFISLALISKETRKSGAKLARISSNYKFQLEELEEKLRDGTY